jgi:hypothetical protein
MHQTSTCLIPGLTTYDSCAKAKTGPHAPPLLLLSIFISNEDEQITHSVNQSFISKLLYSKLKRALSFEKYCLAKQGDFSEVVRISGQFHANEPDCEFPSGFQAPRRKVQWQTVVVEEEELRRLLMQQQKHHNPGSEQQQGLQVSTTVSQRLPPSVSTRQPNLPDRLALGLAKQRRKQETEVAVAVAAVKARTATTTATAAIVQLLQKKTRGGSGGLIMLAAVVYGERGWCEKEKRKGVKRQQGELETASEENSQAAKGTSNPIRLHFSRPGRRCNRYKSISSLSTRLQRAEKVNLESLIFIFCLINFRFVINALYNAVGHLLRR